MTAGVADQQPAGARLVALSPTESLNLDTVLFLRRRPSEDTFEVFSSNTVFVHHVAAACIEAAYTSFQSGGWHVAEPGDGSKCIIRLDAVARVSVSDPAEDGCTRVLLFRVGEQEIPLHLRLDQASADDLDARCRNLFIESVAA